MKAVVLKAARDLAFGDVTAPTSSEDQVLVRITHSGICGTDLKIYNGSIAVRHPLIMGHEMVGEVAEADGGSHFQRGDRVIVDPFVSCGICFHCRGGQSNLCPHGVLLGRDADGGFAEFVAAPSRNIFHLPGEIDSAAAPLIQVLTTCLHAQRLVDIFPGESVAVIGLGVTGQLHVQLAKARGAYPVIGITRSKWKRELAEQLGADVTLSAGDGAIRGVIDATQGRGADVIIETTGAPEAIADAIRMARLGARLLLFGITTATEAALPFYQLYFKELKVINSRAAKAEDFPTSIDLVRRGSVRLQPLITDVVPLANLGAAMQMLESDTGRRMKIILDNK
jgi:2-desacetyl-2-hydroxyethyl bacteriochlorophyllide A dehydrogenase